MGFKRAHKFAPFLTFIFHDLLKLRRGVVMKNLSLAFPELSEEEKAVLCRKCYISAAKTFIELMAFPVVKYDQIEGYFSDEAVNMGRAAFERGKGVILLTAHFGNWELAALGYPKKVGFPLSTLVQPQRNGYITNWMVKARTMWGNKIYRTGHAAMTLYKALKNGELIGIAGDQRGPEDGLRVPFFGISSAVNEGTATLALRADAPILMGFMVRQPDNSYDFKLHEISTENLPKDKNEAVKEVTARHTALLEKYVREYPDQYFWMHNRWKY
ncbi:MAG: lysophospholipid acyltransferase family protein [Ignavibacteria bacterium]|nr:lysophospholipid acyltransferase family protein [Ignavibacteria bacterium]MBZ0196184.1 lysophospholipid acyltransferase family protein [Ignavibacteriaceae bacterium]